MPQWEYAEIKGAGHECYFSCQTPVPYMLKVEPGEQGEEVPGILTKKMIARLGIAGWEMVNVTPQVPKRGGRTGRQSLTLLSILGTSNALYNSDPKPEVSQPATPSSCICTFCLQREPGNGGNMLKSSPQSTTAPSCITGRHSITGLL